MATTLVIKNANFSANALDTVSFVETKPCTGVSLNKSTSSILYQGTDTLVATVTPVDTTDILSWASSNSDVAIVANGVVTAVGVGNATITATCGSFSAECSIIVTATVSGATLAGKRFAGSGAAGGGTGAVYPDSGTKFGIIYSATGEKLIYYDYSDYYPIIIPQNTTKVRIVKGTNALTIYRVPLMDTSKTPTGILNSCLMTEFYDESNMTSVGDNTFEFTIPTYESYTVNAIAFSFSKSTTFADSDFDGIEIQFLAS